MSLHTYGGEIEMLAVYPDGSLAPMNLASIPGFNSEKKHLPIDTSGGLTYDSCTHLLEANIFPTLSLGDLLTRVKTVVSTTIDVAHSNGVHLLNVSTYPLGTYQEAYTNNVRKVIYALFRGPSTDTERVLIDALGEDYQHRSWRHESSSMFAGIQPWNSVDLEDIESILESLSIGSPLGKYATANGGYMEGKNTQYTDNRWRMYDPSEGMVSTSIYPEDSNLVEKFPGKNFTLSGYFHHVFSNFHMSFIGNKNGLLAFKKPVKVEDILQSRNIPYVNASNNTEGIIGNPIEELSFSDIYESCIFFPDFKLRIVAGEDGSEIKGQELLDLFEAIKSGDESKIKDIFQNHRTRFCIEGRNYSTNLPQGEDFSNTYFPFIFQTLLIKNHKKIVEIGRGLGINFGELNKHIYKNGLDGKDVEKLIQLTEAIFSDTEGFSKAEQVLIDAARVKFINIVKNGNPKSIQDKHIHGDNVTAFIQSNLV